MHNNIFQWIIPEYMYNPQSPHSPSLINRFTARYSTLRPPPGSVGRDPRVAEIVVADCGSSDGTRDIARRKGAKVRGGETSRAGRGPR